MHVWIYDHSRALIDLEDFQVLLKLRCFWETGRNIKISRTIVFTNFLGSRCFWETQPCLATKTLSVCEPSILIVVEVAGRFVYGPTNTWMGHICFYLFIYLFLLCATSSPPFLTSAAPSSVLRWRRLWGPSSWPWQWTKKRMQPQDEKEKSESEVTCGQVWWLGICALHLTYPSAHTHSSKHTHTHLEHTPGAVGSQCWGARGAVGGPVPCTRVSPQSWYWGWRERWSFTPPTYNPCRTWDSNPRPLGYKSDSLSIRPRLCGPKTQDGGCHHWKCNQQ